MQEKLSELKNIHKKIFELYRNNFNLESVLERSGYLKIPIDELTKLENEYNNNDKLQKDLEKKLTSIIAKTNEFILFKWIDENINCCKKIIKNELKKQKPDTTKISVAKETISKWKHINEATKKYIIPNPYYLSDYFYYCFNK